MAEIFLTALGVAGLALMVAAMLPRLRGTHSIRRAIERQRHR